MTNFIAFDFTHRQIIKTIERDYLGGVPVHLHTLHIPKATIAFTVSCRYIYQFGCNSPLSTYWSINRGCFSAPKTCFKAEF